MNQLVIDALGWIGTISYLIAYFLVSTKRLEGDAVSYQLMNLIGGILLTVNTFYYRSFPAVTVNAAWIGISLFALGRVWLAKQ